MLINKNTIIKGRIVVLVPYRKEHVPKYHDWMKSEELQFLTASEPLTLEEEYEMQKSWQNDENKLTFIILDKNKFEETGNELESMIGDTNLFFASEQDHSCAEAEIMIAEQWARRKRRGLEAMLLMFIYAIDNIGVKKFVAKISLENRASIAMFKSMRFKEVCTSKVFQEVTLERTMEDNWPTWVKQSLETFQISD